ncbi:MAG: DUF4091 domain-containing protein, partial [Planctomycetes bacterium]|nr:DUF4091 domain-containing protein [Planctomycetota bacterium]
MRMVMILALLASIGRLALAEPAPVTNGGFEDGMGEWYALKPKEFAHGELSLVTTDAHSGKQAVRIANAPTGEKVLVGLTHQKAIKLPDHSRTFALTVWMKAAKAPQMVEFRIASAGKDGKALTPWDEKGWKFIRPAIEPHVGKWHRARAEFAAQQEWDGFFLTVWINGAGADVLVDDIELEATNPTDWMVKSIGRRLPDPMAGVALWWEGPLRKVFPNEPPPTEKGSAVELAAAGDECEAVQVCLRPDQPLTNATVTFSDLAGPATIPAAALKANFVGFVDVKEAKCGRSMLGLTPDPLLPDERMTIPAGRTQPLWVTLHVPRGAKPGNYAGRMTVRADGFEAAIPLSVRVYGFNLPERPRLKTIARIWQHHEGYIHLFRKNLQEHRCSGTSYIGGITARREGDEILVGVAKLKETADANLRAFGFEVFNVPSVFLGDASGPYAKDGKWNGFDLFSPEFDRAFESYCKQVGDALRAEGLSRCALWQIWDEPHGPMLQRCVHIARLVKKAVPDSRIYLTTGVTNDLLDLVDIWNLPWPSTYSAESAAKARARGASLWAYDNSLYSLDVADSSLLMRSFPWRLRRYDIAGVEWWAVSQWKSDPWTVPNQYPPQNGGGFFLYPTPDRKGAPIDSIRWELYREGVEDYDILSLLADEQDRVLKALGVTDER